MSPTAWALTSLAALLIAVTGVLPVHAQTAPVSATVLRVIDGDTVDVQLADGRGSGRG